MKLKKFDKLCSSILEECNCNCGCKNPLKYNKNLYIDQLFSPKKPFKITDEMLVNGKNIFNNEDNWYGKVLEILSNDEILCNILGTYKDNCLTPLPTFDEDLGIYPLTIKYKLTPGDTYCISDENYKPETESKNWLETIFKILGEADDLETEDGEGGCCAGGGEAGLSTNAVFGSGDTAGDSLIQNSHKDPNGPGITTHDMKAMYTLHLNPKKSKKYPVFKRKKI